MSNKIISALVSVLIYTILLILYVIVQDYELLFMWATYMTGINTSLKWSNTDK
jgi:hypothetical protein